MHHVQNGQAPHDHLCPTGLKNKRNERVIKIQLMLRSLALREVPYELLAEVLGVVAESYAEYDKHADFVRLDNTISGHLEDIVPDHSKDLTKMLRMYPSSKKPNKEGLAGTVKIFSTCQDNSLTRSCRTGGRSSVNNWRWSVNFKSSRGATMEYYPVLEQKQHYEEQQGPCVRDYKPSSSPQRGKLTVVHEGHVNAHGHCTFCTNAGRPNPAQCHFLKRHPSATSTWYRGGVLNIII